MRRYKNTIRESNGHFRNDGEKLAYYFDNYHSNALRGRDLDYAEAELERIFDKLIDESSGTDYYNLVCEWTEEEDVSNSYSSHVERTHVLAKPVIENALGFLDWLYEKGYGTEDVKYLYDETLAEELHDYILDEVEDYYDEVNDEYYDTHEAQRYNGKVISYESDDFDDEEEDDESYDF